MLPTDEDIQEAAERLIDEAVVTLFNNINADNDIPYEDKLEVVTLLFNLNMDGFGTIEGWKVQEIIERKQN